MSGTIHQKREKQKFHLYFVEIFGRHGFVNFKKKLDPFWRHVMSVHGIERYSNEF